MKHLLFIAFALGLFTNSFGQDLLVTAKGDTLRCKILSQTDQQIFISTLQPDGTSVSSYVSKDTIQTITPGYFGNGDLVGTSLDSPQTNIQSPKKKKRAKDGVRFAISGGYSSRLGKLAEGANSSYRHGFTLMVIWLVSLTITSVWERSPITDNTAKLMLAVGLWVPNYSFAFTIAPKTVL